MRHSIGLCFNSIGPIQCPHVTGMGYNQWPNCKTATDKPFAQQWILGCHRIITPALTLLTVGSKLGWIGFTMTSWQAMFYRGYRASPISVNKH